MILFEVHFLEADNIRAEIVYENLELFIVRIIYCSSAYCNRLFSTVLLLEFGGILDLEFVALSALIKFRCRIHKLSVSMIQNNHPPVVYVIAFIFIHGK